MSQPSIKFSGMCVGGPMAGEHIVRDSATFKCALQVPAPRPGKDFRVDGPMEYLTQNFHYKHITLLVVQDGQSRSWDFFTSRDCTIGDVLDEVLEDYAHYQDLKS